MACCYDGCACVPACLPDHSSLTDTIAMAGGTLVGTQLIVKVRSMTGEEHEICVCNNTSLRDVQETVCRLYRAPFPKTKVCLTHGGHTYDEFSQRPFINCCGGEVMNAVFIKTDDPYFYDLRDRRRRPRQPSLELEWALVAAPLRLPPSIVREKMVFEP